MEETKSLSIFDASKLLSTEAETGPQEALALALTPILNAAVRWTDPQGRREAGLLLGLFGGSFVHFLRVVLAGDGLALGDLDDLLNGRVCVAGVVELLEL